MTVFGGQVVVVVVLVMWGRGALHWNIQAFLHNGQFTVIFRLIVSLIEISIQILKGETF